MLSRPGACWGGNRVSQDMLPTMQTWWRLRYAPTSTMELYGCNLPSWGHCLGTRLDASVRNHLSEFKASNGASYWHLPSSHWIRDNLAMTCYHVQQNLFYMYLWSLAWQNLRTTEDSNTSRHLRIQRELRFCSLQNNHCLEDFLRPISASVLLYNAVNIFPCPILQNLRAHFCAKVFVQRSSNYLVFPAFSFKFSGSSSSPSPKSPPLTSRKRSPKCSCIACSFGFHFWVHIRRLASHSNIYSFLMYWLAKMSLGTRRMDCASWVF